MLFSLVRKPFLLLHLPPTTFTCVQHAFAVWLQCAHMAGRRCLVPLHHSAAPKSIPHSAAQPARVAAVSERASQLRTVPPPRRASTPAPRLLGANPAVQVQTPRGASVVAAAYGSGTIGGFAGCAPLPAPGPQRSSSRRGDAWRTWLGAWTRDEAARCAESYPPSQRWSRHTLETCTRLPVRREHWHPSMHRQPRGWLMVAPAVVGPQPHRHRYAWPQPHTSCHHWRSRLYRRNRSWLAHYILLPHLAKRLCHCRHCHCHCRHCHCHCHYCHCHCRYRHRHSRYCHCRCLLANNHHSLLHDCSPRHPGAARSSVCTRTEPRQAWLVASRCPRCLACGVAPAARPIDRTEACQRALVGTASPPDVSHRLRRERTSCS